MTLSVVTQSGVLSFRSEKHLRREVRNQRKAVAERARQERQYLRRMKRDVMKNVSPRTEWTITEVKRPAAQTSAISTGATNRRRDMTTKCRLSTFLGTWRGLHGGSVISSGKSTKHETLRYTGWTD